MAGAAGSASANVQTVAAAAEELSASIGEITRQVSDAARIAGRAVEEARRTDGTVQGLADGARKIGAVAASSDAVSTASARMRGEIETFLARLKAA